MLNRSVRIFGASLAAALMGATTAAHAQADLKVDVGSFAYDGTDVLLETYVSIGAASLAYDQADEGYRADVPLRIELLPVASSAPAAAQRDPVVSREVAMRFVVPDTSALQREQVFVEQMRMTAQPGDYTLRMTANAGTDQPEVRLEFDVEVPDYGEGVHLSSLQVASRIEQATDAADPFVKSGVMIHPNPDARYGGVQRRVPYYVEAYLPGMTGEYTFLSYVASSDRPAPIPGTESRRARQARPVDVIIGQVDISELPTGIYFLRTAVLDAENSALAETSKKIVVINPDVEQPQEAALQLGYEETAFGLMGEEELEEAVASALVLADNSERVAAGALQTDEQRRTWLSRFWAARDADQDPFENAAHREHVARVAAAAERYRESAGRRGVETERGATFVKYGPPSEIDRRTNRSDQLPHEVWTYDNIPGAGRSIFVFVDEFQSNTYDLIHSNVPGEISSPDWERELTNN